MATIPYTKTIIAGGHAHLYTWPNMAASDVGQELEINDLPQLADRTVQFECASWNGSTATLKGSLDGSNYEALTDPQGNAIAKTANALEAITELTRSIRPEVTGGTANAVNVTLLARFP